MLTIKRSKRVASRHLLCLVQSGRLRELAKLIVMGVLAAAAFSVELGAQGTAKSECTTVTVWLPEDSGDFNGSVVLEVSPPPIQKDGRCSVWKYRYGGPPHQEAPQAKTRPLIHPKKSGEPPQRKPPQAKPRPLIHPTEIESRPIERLLDLSTGH